MKKQVHFRRAGAALLSFLFVLLFVPTVFAASQKAVYNQYTCTATESGGVQCSNCNGSGKAYPRCAGCGANDWNVDENFHATCRKCGHLFMSYDEPCFRCKGTGYSEPPGITYSRGSFIQKVSIFYGGVRTNCRNSDGYWYEFVRLYALPTIPASISHAGAHSGQPLPVSWGASTDSDGDLSGYVLERSVNGAAYTQVYRGNALSYTDTPQKSWNTVAYRVKAYDAQGQESGYRTGSTVTVIHNSPPVIDGQDTDAGPQKGGMELSYTVTDPDPGDTITISEAVDAAIFNSFTAVSGTAYRCAVPADVWAGLEDGPHTLRITAQDSYSSTVLRSVAFEKRSRITATVPTLLAFSIDPDKGTFTAPEFQIENHEAYPLEITFEGLTAKEGTMVRLAAPDAFPDWAKLGAEDTHQNLALGIRQGDQTHWFGGEALPAFPLPANAAQPFSLEARFGSAWRDAVSLGFDLAFHINIP